MNGHVNFPSRQHVLNFTGEKSLATSAWIQRLHHSDIAARGNYLRYDLKIRPSLFQGVDYHRRLRSREFAAARPENDLL